MSMNPIFKLTALCCSLGLVACSPASSLQREAVADPLFLQVAAAPQTFEGKTVTLRGWVSLRHEDRNLWVTKADHERWQTPRCLSLSLYDALLDRAGELDGRLVEVTGVVSSDASKGGRVIRLGACRDVAIAVSQMRRMDSHTSEGRPH